MKTTVTILSILVIILLGYIFLMPSEPKESELKIIHQRDSLHLEFKRLQAGYDLKAMHADKLKAELLESKAVVKRSEEKLTKSLANEKVYLKRIKEQTRLMSSIEADSIIRARYQDSIPQKVVYDLARLDLCNSLRSSQDSLIQKFREMTSVSDSLNNQLKDLVENRNSAISNLQSSSDKADQIIQSKDKEIKKLKRRNKALKVLVPVAVVLTVIVML